MAALNQSLKSHGSADPERLREIYNQQAATYDQSRFKTAYQRRLDLTERRILRRHLLNCSNALEVGVGTGRLTGELLAKSFSVTAVDISENMLAQVRQKYPQANNLILLRADAHELPKIPNYGAFDAVLCMRMLPHIEDIAGLLSVLKNAVKPGGTVITDFWNRNSYVYRKKRGSSVYNNYVTYPEAVQILGDAGLEVITIEGGGFGNRLQWNLEILGRTPLKYFGYSLVSICRRPAA